MTSGNGRVCAQTPPSGNVNLADVPGDFEGPTQALLMTLEIYEEAIFRTRYADGRAAAVDELHPADVAAAMAGIKTGTGLLPQGVLFCQQAGVSAEEYRMGMYLAPGARRLRLDLGGERVARYEVPLPGFVFVGQGSSYSIFALADQGWPGAEAELYQAPLPNVHTSAAICAGTVAFPRCRPDTIEAAARLFFESHFNQHLRNRKSQKHEHNIVAVYRELMREGAEGYPVDDLVGLGKRLGDLVQDAA